MRRTTENRLLVILAMMDTYPVSIQHLVDALGLSVRSVRRLLEILIDQRLARRIATTAEDQRVGFWVATEEGKRWDPRIDAPQRKRFVGHLTSGWSSEARQKASLRAKERMRVGSRFSK